MDRIVNIAFAVALLGLAWMQVDTWRQARETNEFIRRIHEVIAKPPAQTGESGV